jgi:hypothetical protein
MRPWPTSTAPPSSTRPPWRASPTTSGPSAGRPPSPNAPAVPTRRSRSFAACSTPRGRCPTTAAPGPRRRLAQLLADRAGDADLAQALALLDVNRTAFGETPADHRARALVLAARPEGRGPAIRTVEASRSDGPLAPDEELRLAQLYDAEGDWPRARDLMAGLLARDGQDPACLSAYARALLRHGQTEEAAVWVDRLARVEPGSARTRALRDELAARRQAEPATRGTSTP